MQRRFNRRFREGGILKGESKFYVSLAHDAADVRHTLDVGAGGGGGGTGRDARAGAVACSAAAMCHRRDTDPNASAENVLFAQKAKSVITGLEKPINDHLLKLLVVETGEHEHWIVELLEWLDEVGGNPPQARP